VRVLRFRNERIIEELEGVLAEIAEYLTPAPQAQSGPIAAAGQNELWVKADNLEIGSQIVLDESGAVAVIEVVESCFVNETVYDLIVAEDHSFITEAGCSGQS
jgi:intein/homing endonuclease